jgi:hypothetical protein
VAERFFYTDAGFAGDLAAAREAEFNKLSAKGALELVRRIDGHIARLRALMTEAQQHEMIGEKRE